MKRKVLRQGDVVLVPVESIPETKMTRVQREAGRLVLSRGEVTGHAHVIGDETTELVSPEGAAELYLLVHGISATLTHEEHQTLRVPGGAYEVRTLREYAPDTSRLVRD